MCETESKNEIVTDEKGAVGTKDYFTPQKNKASKELAELFGQSENQLKKEFGIYKAKKIYKKLSYFVDAKAKLREEVIKELQNAKKRELYSVLVYPTQVSLAKLILKGTETKVRAVINFPSGEEFYKVTKNVISKVFLNGADEVLIMISSYSILNDYAKDQLKHIKKIIKRFKKRNIAIMLDCTDLTAVDVERGIKAIRFSGAQSVMLVNFKGSFDKGIIQDSVLLLNGKAQLECFPKLISLENAVALLLDGVSVLTLVNALDIADELSKMVNLVGEDSEALDKTNKEAYN